MNSFIIYRFLSEIAKKEENKNKIEIIIKIFRISFAIIVVILQPSQMDWTAFECRHAFFDVTSNKLKLPTYQGKTQQSKTLESEESFIFFVICFDDNLFDLLIIIVI